MKRKANTQDTSGVILAMIELEKQTRFNPIKDLTPERLTQYMDEFRAGNVQNLARAMTAIEETDDVLISVVPKAKDAVAQHGFEILTVKTENEEQAKLALDQKAKLEFFYNNVRATSALDQDELGGFSLLARQMYDAKGKRYSVHNIVWKPCAGGNYSATFIHTPLWFFENMKGKMRFIRQQFGYYGEEMEHGAWLVTVGLGIMIACSVAWMFKHLPLRDWVLYCKRHGLPGIEGVTDAKVGSEEWNNTVAAVRAAASEFKWVRNRSSEIKTIQFGAEGQLPHPPLVERMDRALATIWRGGDLGTMSKDGQAVGSNPQEKETVSMEVADAQWLTETLNLKVDRLVLDYIYGPDAPALAYVKILTAKKQNTELDLKIDEFATAHGHPISQQQFAERFNRPVPDAKAVLLTATRATPTPSQEPPDDLTAANEAEQSATLAQAVAKDLQPFLAAADERLQRILGITDPVLRKQKWDEAWTELSPLAKDISADPATAKVFQQILTIGLLKGVAAKSS